MLVNDRMQQGYRYRRVAPEGSDFDAAFEPQLTPAQMLEVGVFCGKCMTDCRDEFPAASFVDAKLATGRPDCTLNHFGVKASAPLSEWRTKGWIHPDDPRGWFRWYCRYYSGRRIPGEDARQIGRRHAFRRHAAQLCRHCEPGDPFCRPKQRQALLQWAYASRVLQLTALPQPERAGTVARFSGSDRHRPRRYPGATIGVPSLTSSSICRRAAGSVCVAAFALAFPAVAQDVPAGNEKPPVHVRAALGPQLLPNYPGADELQLAPLIDVAIARGDELYEFEAPDESFGRAIFTTGGFSIGPAFSFEGSRKPEDVGTAVPKVDWTLELGAFAQYEFGDGFRLYSELRKGVNGHEGWAALGGADVIFRDRNKWLFSLGPRVTWTDDTYQDAFFSIAPADAGPSGLPAFDARGGIQAAGATASFVYQLSEQWGLYGYAKYDRLVGDPADSPLVRQYGSRDQIAGGVALTYTFNVNGLDWLD